MRLWSNFEMLPLSAEARAMRAFQFRSQSRHPVHQNLILALALGLANLPVLAQSKVAFETEPAKQVDGRSLGQWADAWWVWAKGWEDGKGPLWSRDGKDCAAGKQKDVVLIGGSYTNDPVRRVCRVGAGSRLFFPIFTSLQTQPRGDCKVLSQEVSQQLGEVGSMYLKAGEARSELPQLQASRIGTCAVLRKRSGPPVAVAQEGYWFMTQPLAAGTYRLEFGGKWGDYQQDIVYDIEVK